MTQKASVTKNGAVLLGKQVACDSHDPNRPIRAVTHAHYDHLGGLQQSLRKCKAVVMTPATRDLLTVLRGRTSLARGNIYALNYGETLKYDGERVTLHPADHILGAAQVLVEDHDGARIVYSGDFRMSHTPILKTDILVLEATYGNAFQVRPFKKIVEPTLISLVESALRTGPLYIFGYHGKLQEVMQILHENDIEAPFILPEKVFHIAKVCERYGMHLGKVLSADEEEAKEIAMRNEPHVAFYHMNSKRYVGANAFRICVSGWEFSGPRRQVGPNEHIVALSDHADFKELLQYVSESRPKLVITDNYRVGDAVGLAREIEKRLGIPAKALPS
ncbi:MAG TPA: MBL fold metallo-hydrolase [Candidatus Bathyarchaeia archaeon]|nr:MBL fold metallo-hydrolase [Candidatus Bathyarchaeia archaeon]